MKITFADLPYRADALEPYYSAQTVKLHYEKHHRGYFDKTVKAITGTKFEDMSLEDIVRETARDEKYVGLFRNAAQLWNHDMFWRSMRPEGGGRPEGALAQRIARDFGGYESMLEALKDCAVKQFGSGWAWLVFRDGKLSATATHDADNPLVDGATPLLALDVWEHAYYLDYQNRRPEYVAAFLDRLANWRHAAEMLETVTGAGEVKEKRRAAR